MKAGLVVVVNGASSSGKTSLARALQLVAPDPWLHAGIDRFWGMMPQGWMQLGARAGSNVVSDDVFFDRAWAGDWAAALDGIDAWLVGLHCSDDELERRERGRGDREPGEARAEAAAIHEGMPYDLELDSSSLSSDALAVAVLDHVAGARPWALEVLRGDTGA